ncbi:hypothetical protein ACOZ35_12560 [Halorubrum xinjiangense]|uniref:hypothetical protein n=1 Tax=Halorubrum xinjiangense TaxID=261291 RepID=UPI003C6F7F81
MNPDRSPSRRTVHPDLYANPHRSAAVPSLGTAIAFAALPIVTIAALSFPVAAAVTLAALCGAVAGAALARRQPNAVNRALRLPNDEGAVREA